MHPPHSDIADHGDLRRAVCLRLLDDADFHAYPTMATLDLSVDFGFLMMRTFIAVFLLALLLVPPRSRTSTALVTHSTSARVSKMFHAFHEPGSSDVSPAEGKDLQNEFRNTSKRAGRQGNGPSAGRHSNVEAGRVPRYRDSHASEIAASGSLGSKGFPERATLSMALRSLRSAATRASFFGFPRATRPS